MTHAVRSVDEILPVPKLFALDFQHVPVVCAPRQAEANARLTVRTAKQA